MHVTTTDFNLFWRLPVVIHEPRHEKSFFGAYRFYPKVTWSHYHTCSKTFKNKSRNCIKKAAPPLLPMPPPPPPLGNLPLEKCPPPEICPTPRNLPFFPWRSARPKSLGKYETVRYFCTEIQILWVQSAPVICIHCPPPTGMGGDNDFLKIKALLKPLHCGDKWKVTALLFSPTPGGHEKGAFKCYRPHPEQAFPSERPTFAAVNSPLNQHIRDKKNQNRNAWNQEKA